VPRPHGQGNAAHGAIAGERIVAAADRPCRRCDGFHVGVQLMVNALRVGPSGLNRERGQAGMTARWITAW